ncbi:MAG: putative lipid II flippase FtsW [Candidatus Riflebacteria bacterium]|nr:putative lipid II flippase FtsW [Candidatus Riflebacteria bacterium]
MKETSQFDYILFFAIIALMASGLVMVFSASSVTSLSKNADGLFYFKRQLAWVILGLAGMIIFSRINYRNWSSLAVPLLGLAIFLLILVLIPGVSKEIGGAKRWLRFKGFGFQPSELAKLAFIIYLSNSFHMREEHLMSFKKGMIPDLLVTGILFLLIYKEPNLSTAALIVGTYFTMYFLVGGSMKNLSLLTAAGGMTILFLIFQEPYRIRRIKAFFSPGDSPTGFGYHIIQSLIAIGSGGLFGLGLGESRQKFFMLPERHTDFIFSIICEELGLLGGAIVLALFLVLIWRGLYIAVRAPDTFGFCLAAGITAVTGLQVIVNIGVVLSLLPTTGITLPFISYGGSSVVFMALGMGILLNISKYGSEKNAFEMRKGESFSKQFIEPVADNIRRR